MEVENPLTDPEERARAARSAEELVHTAETLPSDAAADKLIAAAEVYRAQLGDLARAATLLRRAVNSDAHALRALTRLRLLAEARGDWQEVADVLDHLVRRIDDDEERLRVLAARADVLSHRLGRVAEARRAYREVMRLSDDDGLRTRATEAARRIDHILEQRILGPDLAAQLAPPVVPPSPKPRLDTDPGAKAARVALPRSRSDTLVIEEPLLESDRRDTDPTGRLGILAQAAPPSSAAATIVDRPVPVSPLPAGVAAVDRARPSSQAGSAGLRRAVSVGDTDWSRAVEFPSMDTTVDQRAGSPEREAIARARSDAERRGLHAKAERRAESSSGLDRGAAARSASQVPSEIGDLARRERVVDALRAGELETVLELVESAKLEPPDGLGPGLVLRAGLEAAELGAVAEAERCLHRAEGLRVGAVSPLERRAWTALINAQLEAGLARAAADAFTRLSAALGDGREGLHMRQDLARGRLLTAIGSALGEAGDVDGALRWLKDALATNPLPAATAIARLLVAGKHAGHLRSLSDRMDRIDLRGPDRARWLVVLAESHAGLADFQAARDALDTALSVDPAETVAADALVTLGGSAREPDWVDEGLRELRVRALERGEPNRVFLATALLVFRQVATPEERGVYEGLRMGLHPRPRVPIDPRALAAAVAPGWEVPSDAPRGRPVAWPDPVPAGIAEVVAELEAMLLIPSAEARPKNGAKGSSLTLALDEWPTCRRALAFEVARLLVASSDPGLSRGVKGDPAIAARLDRAALVLVQDPVIALEAVGRGTERAEGLEAFAASPDLPRLWARYGLGLESRRSVAKAAHSV